MHNHAMEMGKWAMEKAKACGYDNLSSQDWDDLKDCLEVVKCAICADKDYRIIEAMDEAEEMEQAYGRMGYDRYRYESGRFAPKGRGTRMGYRPYLYMQDDEWMNQYLNNPNFDEQMYRMGYRPDRKDGNYIWDNANRSSRYGEAYDRYDDSRRHYHESKDAESKRKMDDSIKEHTQNAIHSMSEMWADADQTIRQNMKSELTKLLQQMN